MPSYSGVWTLSQQFQGRGQGLWPQSPGAPTIGTASVSGIGIARVAFTAPACTGVPAVITGYIAKSTPGCITATGSSSPITISGLCSSTAYTFAVAAQNASGYGAYSAQSNSVTPNAVIGQDAYTTPGTYTWVKPSGVTNVSIVAVGAGGSGASYYYAGEIGVCWCGFGGGGGGGGGLAYLNNYDVSARSSLQIIVGTGGSSSTTVNTCTGAAIFTALRGTNAGSNCGGAPGFATGTFTAAYTGGAGGGGGYTACGSNTCGGGGGGAAGYAGSGGNGRCARFGATGAAGAGGGGGGGNTTNGGGGVGILGQGANGAANGGGGSGGASTTGFVGGGAYGGGGGGSTPGAGAGGAVRIIYPGTTRSFPSTNTGNL